MLLTFANLSHFYLLLEPFSLGLTINLAMSTMQLIDRKITIGILSVFIKKCI